MRNPSFGEPGEGSSRSLAANIRHPVYAVVPAAGLSRRMGQPKLALPLGERAVLEHVLDALFNSLVAQTVVVVGPSVVNLTDLVTPPAQVVRLQADTTDMRETVTYGLRAIDERYLPGREDAFLLALGDQPTIRSEIVNALVCGHQTDPTKIRVPMCGAKRGHPVLFPWSCKREAEQLPPDCGLNALLHQNPARVETLVFDDESILQDLDTPADYERAQRRKDW